MADEVLITLDNFRRYHSKLLELIPANQIWRGNGTPPDDTDHILAVSYTEGKIYFKNELGGWIALSGGSGGGESKTDISITHEWANNTKTLAYGKPCVFNFSWSSNYGGSSTGMGMFYLYLTTPDGEELKESYLISQGNKSIDLTNYLALGDTEFIVRITDKYGGMAQEIISVKTVKLELEETFNESRIYTSDVTYYCTPKGAKGKTKKMYIYLDDELVVNGQETTDDGILQTYTLKVNSHGTHKIRTYFTVVLEEGGEEIPSDEKYSEFAYCVEGDTTPIVVTNCDIDKLEEFDSKVIEWYVFTPNADGTTAENTPLVQIYHCNQPTIPDDVRPVEELENVKYGSTQEHTFKGENVGDNYIIFKVGKYTRAIPIEVTKSPMDVSAVTTGLLLNLSPKHKVNEHSSRAEWVSETPEGTITATLENFNFTSDGWLTSGKSKVLTVRDDARVNIPVKIFTDDILTTGVTIEFEIATHDVLDYEATIIECMNSGIGISVQANQSTLKTKNNTLVTPFREGEQVRVTFVIEGNNSPTKLILIYINGVLSGAKQYTSTDNFAQSVAQGITIGSNFCATDIYAIRVYKSALGRQDVLNNWIADTQDRELLLERYKRNNVFGENGLHPDNLPEGCPYLVFYTSEDGLPKVKGKGEQKYLNGKYVDKNREFTFTNSEVKVQGTSSSGYPRKNFTMTFDDKNGIILNGDRTRLFKMNDDSIATNSFCFKADYASSEGANNVELVKLFNELAPKTPPQEDNSNVRQGIDGFPMVIFCYHDKAYYFIGKYNFNNDKGTPEVYGMTEGVESWEITNNGTPMGEYQEDDFDTLIHDSDTGTWSEKWLDTFEARYPEDNEGYENLQQMVAWVRSTWRDEADAERRLEPSVTYGDKTYEYDTAEYRKAKFINEASDWFDVEHLQFFYWFTDFFLMIDNREKNTFPTRYFNKELNKWLWYFLPYDFDTALGINNSGELVFGHGLEDTDEGVYNGANSVLWCNVRDYFADEIKAMYIRLRNQTDIFNYDEITRRFTEHQRTWGEAIFNEDSYYKYIAILLGKDGTAEHLPKLQGNKEAQRNYWLYNRFRYYDAKCVTGDALEEKIIIRPNYIEGGNNNHNIDITSYTDTYFSINFDSMSGTSKPIPKRAKKGVVTSFTNPKARPDNAVVHIYNASQITDLGDLSGQYTSEFVGNQAIRLQRLILGNDNIINTELNHLSLGNNILLKVLNVKNCPNLATDIDISGCSGIEEVYFDGTSITSLVLPKGGSCKTLHLPETITNLTIINHKVTDFSMPNYNNLSTLWLELNETSKGTFDLKAILDDMIEKFKASEEGELGRLRVTNFELTGDKAFDTAKEVIDFYTDLRKYFKGMDSNGVASADETYLRNMLQGKIEIKEETILGSQLKTMQDMFPEVEIAYKNVVSSIHFYVDGVWVHSTVVYNGGDCSDPVGTYIGTPTKAETETTRFRFEGWDDDLKKVTADRDVNAIFSEHTKYVVTFMNGTVRHSKASYIKDETIVLPSNPKKESTTAEVFTFIGWSLDGANVVTVPKTMGEENLTYYAVYRADPRPYTITWYIGSRTVTTTEYYDATKQPTPPSGYTYAKTWVDGKVFLGWYNLGYCTGDREILAILKGTKTTKEPVNWGTLGITSDDYGTITNKTDTSFTADSDNSPLYFAQRKLGIDTSQVPEIGFKTTIQSIKVTFKADKSIGHGAVRILAGLGGKGDMGLDTTAIEEGELSITMDLNEDRKSLLANSNGVQNVWFGLYEGRIDTCVSKFWDINFIIEYHTND